MQPAPPPPVVIVAPPPPDPASTVEDPEPSPDPRARERATWKNGAIEVTVGTSFFFPDLSAVTFTGSGSPSPGGARIPFSHRGGELGMRSPIIAGGELQVHYLRRYFAVGGTAFYGGHLGPADAAPDPANNVASTQVNESSMLVYGFALDIAGALPLGDRVALRLGPNAGARVYSLPLSGFAPDICQTRRTGPFPCSERATAAQLFVEPRLRVEVSPDKTGGLVFGAFVGADVVGGGVAGGLFLGYQSRPHGGLVP